MKLSRRMLIQGTGIETILRGDIGFLLAQALDLAAINGPGGNAPLGIMGGTSPVVGLGANGAALTLTSAQDLIADLTGAVADANGQSGGFITNSKVQKAFGKFRDTQNRPVRASELFTSPVAFSNQIPNTLTKGTGTNLSALLYGNWQDLVIGYWSSVDLLTNPYASEVAKKGGAYLHAFLDADIGIRHPESFSICRDIVAA